MSWLLQEAKARFSEMVNVCLNEGAQTVTRHGRNTVVLVSYDEYRRLIAPKASLGDFFRQAPRAELEVPRSRDVGRQVDLE